MVLLSMLTGMAVIMSPREAKINRYLRIAEMDSSASD